MPQHRGFFSKGIAQHFQSKGTCPYLHDHRESRTEYLIFSQSVDPSVYGPLIRDGWRRYGKAIYRMQCPGCRLCIPLRLYAPSIRLSSSLRRMLLINRDMLIIPRPPIFTEEHYLLWRNYSIWKHSSLPDELDEASYSQLFEPWSLIFEYRENGSGQRLLGVSHADPVADGLSSVYFSFEPEAKARSLGFFSVLAEASIAISIELGELRLNTPIPATSIISFYTKGTIGSRSDLRRYYYLGFWIPGAPNMDYKARIRPFELAICDDDTGIGRWTSFASRDDALAYLCKRKWPGLPPPQQPPPSR